MKSWFIIACLVSGLFICGACVPESSQMKRMSADGSKEIIYLFDDVAIVRTTAKNGEITLTGVSEKKFNELVSARWLNKPTLVSETGDEVLFTFLPDILKVNYDDKKKIVYGVAFVRKNAIDERLSDESSFFVLQNGKLLVFSERKAFDLCMRDKAVIPKNLRDPATLFGQ